jgi:3-hydroxyisobutyryl-CoA hydrolase
MQTGVTAVLIEKTGDRPAWDPSTLSEIDRATMIAKFFPQKPSENAPSLTLPAVGELRDPNRRALPSEEEIGLMVQGRHRSSGGYSLTLDDLNRQFEELTARKNGVKEKIAEVVQRRCQVDKDGILKWIR